MKCKEPGFEPAAVPDGRRGLWFRVVREGDAIESIESIEIVSGREGDDGNAMLERGHTLTPRLLADIENVLSDLAFASGEMNAGMRQARVAELTQERDALFQRVQELEGAGRAACEVWERVPSASLHEIRETMKLLRKAVDARLPSGQPEGEGGS